MLKDKDGNILDVEIFGHSESNCWGLMITR